MLFSLLKFKKKKAIDDFRMLSLNLKGLSNFKICVQFLPWAITSGNS